MTAHTPNLSPAATVLRIATGYQASQMLFVATKLGIADLLASGAKTSKELARATDTDTGALYRLLRALTAYGVVSESEPGLFSATPLSECLRSDAPMSLRPLVVLYDDENFWLTARAYGECVRTGETAFKRLFGVETSFDYYPDHPELGRRFDDAMTVLSGMTSAAVVKALDSAGAKVLVDVAGGHGRLMAALLKANPKVRGILFDLPRVVEGASSLLEKQGVAERCETIGGDIFESIPRGGDIYMLSRIIHDWDDEHAKSILQNCAAAMGKQSKLVIVDIVLPDTIEPSPGVQSQVLLDLNMLARTGGRERTASEFRALLESAGLWLDRVTPTGTAVSLVEAVKE
jgi:hypothetical protein